MQAIPGLQYNALGGYYGVVGGCGAVSALPTVNFLLNGQAFAVPASQWTQPVCSHELRAGPRLNAFTCLK